MWKRQVHGVSDLPDRRAAPGSSRDNARGCVNAWAQRGWNKGNSGQGGLTGGLLSALMCITALLATNRSRLWGDVRTRRVGCRAHGEVGATAHSKAITCHRQPSLPSAEHISKGLPHTAARQGGYCDPGPLKRFSDNWLVVVVATSRGWGDK